MAVPSKRSFVHAGREVYTWEQGLDEVLVHVTPPPGVRAAAIDCKITATRVRLGLRGSVPFIDVSSNRVTRRPCNHLPPQALPSPPSRAGRALVARRRQREHVDARCDARWRLRLGGAQGGLGRRGGEDA